MPMPDPHGNVERRPLTREFQRNGKHDVAGQHYRLMGRQATDLADLLAIHINLIAVAHQGEIESERATPLRRAQAQPVPTDARVFFVALLLIAAVCRDLWPVRVIEVGFRPCSVISGVEPPRAVQLCHRDRIHLCAR